MADRQAYRYLQTDSDLMRHLFDEYGFLQTSATQFDEGHTQEAKRLAISIRKLCHDTGNSHALLVQLGLLDKLKFVDTNDPIAPTPESEEDEESLEGGTFMTITIFSSPLAPLGYVPEQPPGYSAALGSTTRNPRLEFSAWWNAIVIHDSAGHALSRSDVVLTKANQDGGAHVDPAIRDRAYVAMSREQSMASFSITRNDGTKQELKQDPLDFVTRQVGYELTATLKPIVRP